MKKVSQSGPSMKVGEMSKYLSLLKKQNTSESSRKIKLLMNNKVKPGHNYSEEKGNVYAALKLVSIFGTLPFAFTALTLGPAISPLFILNLLYALAFPLVCMWIHLLVRKI